MTARKAVDLPCDPPTIIKDTVTQCRRIISSPTKPKGYHHVYKPKKRFYLKPLTLGEVAAYADGEGKRYRHVYKPNKRFSPKTYPMKVLVELLQKLVGCRGETLAIKKLQGKCPASIQKSK